MQISFDNQNDIHIFIHVQTILGRKLIVDEMYELMHKVAQLSVSAESEHVRQQSRQVGIDHMAPYDYHMESCDCHVTYYGLACDHVIVM